MPGKIHFYGKPLKPLRRLRQVKLLNEALPRQGTQPIGVTQDTQPIPGSALAILSEAEDLQVQK